MSLRIATRRSALALAQAGAVAQALGGAELVEVVTAGDRQGDAAGGASGRSEGDGAVAAGGRQDRDAGAPGDKSRWVAELERAVLEGRADLAVHSAKDVPAELAPGLAIVAVPVRADARDALCGAGALEELEPGARVGTSSLRRQSQLRALRDDLEVVDLGGNVDTRLRRLHEGRVDALVLAAAGLERLQRSEEAGALLDLERFVPAAGQGTLALEARAGDRAVREALSLLDDPLAGACLRAERTLTAALGASCHTPVGAHAAAGEGDRLTLSAFVGVPDGSAWVSDRLAGSLERPEELGAEVARRLGGAGAGEMLERAEALT